MRAGIGPSIRTVTSMTTAAEIGSATPFFIVRDVPASLDFYRDRLGFDARFQAPDDAPFFAIVGRGATQVMLKAIAPEVEPLPNPVRHEWAAWDAFVHVEDPDALATEFAERGTTLRRPLGDTDDGLRGFEVADPDGYVYFFGRPR